MVKVIEEVKVNSLFKSGILCAGAGAKLLQSQQLENVFTLKQPNKAL
jgi:hypothetical protein